jgi:hypothetical protein
MGKKQPQKIGWARYPVDLSGVRISQALSDAIEADPKTATHGRSAVVRDILSAHYGVDGAQAATQKTKQTA